MKPLEIAGSLPALQQVSFWLSHAYAIAYGAEPFSGDRSTTTVSSPSAVMSSEIQVVSAPVRSEQCKRGVTVINTARSLATEGPYNKADQLGRAHLHARGLRPCKQYNDSEFQLIDCSKGTKVTNLASSARRLLLPSPISSMLGGP
jgi:hypothetical protein